MSTTGWAASPAPAMRKPLRPAGSANSVSSIAPAIKRTPSPSGAAIVSTPSSPMPTTSSVIASSASTKRNATASLTRRPARSWIASRTPATLPPSRPLRRSMPTSSPPSTPSNRPRLRPWKNRSARATGPPASGKSAKTRNGAPPGKPRMTPALSENWPKTRPCRMDDFFPPDPKHGRCLPRGTTLANTLRRVWLHHLAETRRLVNLHGAEASLPFERWQDDLAAAMEPPLRVLYLLGLDADAEPAPVAKRLEPSPIAEEVPLRDRIAQLARDAARVLTEGTQHLIDRARDKAKEVAQTGRDVARGFLRFIKDVFSRKRAREA